MNLLKLTAFSILLIGSIAEIATAQRQEVGILKGQILDAANAVVIGAEVSAVDVDGKEIRVKSNRSGEFVLNLAPGTYRIRVASPGFAVYEDANVVAAARTTVNLNITLTIAIQESKVTVDREGSISTDPNANASATVLKGKDIKALPDNPAELQAALEALAGPGAGPSGGEIFIDGFSGGKLPRRDTIREIRINQNPFSNEYDRFGLGRIEIFTKPGTEKWTGEVGAEFEDESLNSRNPYSANRPPYQLRNISPEFSGPIIKDRLSFYTDFQIESFENNSLTNANILGPDLVATPFLRSVSAPLKTWEFGQRFDAQITKKVTLTSRYGYETSKDSLAGLGGFDLPSRAYRSNDSEHFLRLTETAVISPTVINETRFQFLTTRSSQAEFDASPTIRVLEAFTGGGSNVGNSFVDRDRIELHNYTSWVKGDHIFRFGGRLRQINVTDSSPSNFAGTFTFTSLDQYRDTILNLSGAFPTQFSISGGQPLAKVKRTDLGIFFQDDWNIDPKLTVSAGLRYESQTNISSPWNFAPRFAVAYAPGADGQNKPKTVFRGGFGVFYDRFGEDLTLNALRFNGVNQQRFIVTDPAILDAIVFTQDGVSNIPTAEMLAAFAQPQTTRIVQPDLRATYTLQTAASVERQLPFKTTFSATYTHTRVRRLLRSRNINAPFNGVPPIPDGGNIFQYEATGRFDQDLLTINMRTNFIENVSLFGNYSFGSAKSDTDGAGTFPANSYDLTGEFGRAAIDTRHRAVFGGSISIPFGVSLRPFVIYRSGSPFNITTGEDSNEDTIFTERPAFATSLSEPGIVVTRFGAFDPTPEPGDIIIPRNYGRGPKYFAVNLTAAKEFSFGKVKKSADDEADEDDEGKYKLELSIQVRNLFNRNNGGTPVGNLSSSFFGNSVSSAGGRQSGNRRVRLEVLFSF